MPEKGDSLTRIRGWYSHDVTYLSVHTSDTPGDQPGAGKAYSERYGTVTLYIKGKPNVFGYGFGGIVPRVSNHKLVPVLL
jgi:hypothetical protein